MPISTNCPACGAQVSVNESGGQFTCPYCGASFDVNMEGAQPEFKLAGSGQQPGVEPPIEGQVEETQPDSTAEPSALSTQVDYGYSQPGDPTGPQIYTTIAQAEGFPWRRYGLIAILALTGVFCLACLCMVVIIQRVVR